MIEMAQKRCKDILSSFKSDSTGMPDTCDVRAMELADSPSAKHKWFKNGYKVTTVSGKYRNSYYGIYKNSFSKQRNRYDESARISYNSTKRK